MQKNVTRLFHGNVHILLTANNKTECTSLSIRTTFKARSLAKKDPRYHLSTADDSCGKTCRCNWAPFTCKSHHRLNRNFASPPPPHRLLPAHKCSFIQSALMFFITTTAHRKEQSPSIYINVRDASARPQQFVTISCHHCHYDFTTTVLHTATSKNFVLFPT